MDSHDGETRAEVPADGSQTERTRGTYGGRQRWLQGVDAGTSIASPKKSTPKGKVTAPSVQSFLSTLGIGLGDELQMIDREANDVAAYRREYDTIHNNNIRKEAEIKKLEEALQDASTTISSRKMDGMAFQSKAINLENRAALIENKLEEEMADRGVYNHMIQRLALEVQESKKLTALKEKELHSLNNDYVAGSMSLQTARQEKCTAETMQKKLMKQLSDLRDENNRAIEDMELAIESTRKKQEFMEQREINRRKVAQNVSGEQSARETKKLRQESQIQSAQFAQIQAELMQTDAKLIMVEADLRRLSEAAGTNDIDKIISKYVARDETFRNLKEEHAIADAKMRKLREQYKQLSEQLTTLRGATMNTRGVYQEMDDTAEKLKDIEKNVSALQERCNRSNVLLDAFRSCMLKCMAKMNTVHGSMELENELDLNKANEISTTDLVHMVEQKLSRILDVINREKAEHELHRSETVNGGHGSGNNPNDSKSHHQTQPSPNETEEHFILRVSTADNSQANIRVRPKTQPKASKVAKILRHSQRMPQDIPGTWTKDLRTKDNEDTMPVIDNADEPLIDRAMRKKLVGLVINREKRVKKGTGTNGPVG